MKEIEIKIEDQGAAIVNGGYVYKTVDEVVAIEIAMTTKRGHIPAFSQDHKNIPGICIGIHEESIHFDESKKDKWTQISFPEFRGWRVFCAGYSRYTISVCLTKDES